jgi:hypothetical protein
MLAITPSPPGERLRHTTVRLPERVADAIEQLATYHQCRPAHVVRFILERGTEALTSEVPTLPRH